MLSALLHCRPSYQPNSDEGAGMAGTSDTTQTMKRRGILAAAGAVVAGIVTKGTSQQARAASDSFFYAGGGVSGFAFSNNIGYDRGANLSGITYGVSASSQTGTGVYGETTSGANSKAIWGKHDSNGFGVYGEAADGGYGVTGVATTALGVLGASTSGVGVEGADPLQPCGEHDRGLRQ